MFTPGAVEPTPFLWFMGFVFVVIGLWLGRYLPDVWRAGPAYQKIKRLFDFYGETASKSLVAALPIDSAMLVVGGLMALAILIRESFPGTPRSVVDSASYVIVWSFMVLMVLFFTVLLFGRPRLIIPPHLRSHRGLVPELLISAAERIGSWARKRRGRPQR